MAHKKHELKTSETDELIDFFAAMNIGRKNPLPKSLISPFTMMWDITYNCPFNCIFCYNNSGGAISRNELSEKELLRIADDIVREQVVSVCICGGEPLTRPGEFLKIIERLSDGGVVVNCVSNGWYITPEILNKMCGKIHTIQFSLDAPEPEMFDSIRGKKGAFDQVMKAIRYVSASPLKKCELTFIPTRLNYQLFGEVVKLAVDSGGVSRLRTQHLIQTGRGYNFDLSLNPSEEKEFEDIFLQVNERYKDRISLIFGNPWTHIKYWHEGIIPPIFLQITAEGLAKVSPYIPLTVGNLKTEFLVSVWSRVNNNRGRIRDFLNSYKNMNSYPDDHVPWVDRDYDLMEDIL
jgi:Fe-coproporphyrin III synthase